MRAWGEGAERDHAHARPGCSIALCTSLVSGGCRASAARHSPRWLPPLQRSPDRSVPPPRSSHAEARCDGLLDLLPVGPAVWARSPAPAPAAPAAPAAPSCSAEGATPTAGCPAGARPPARNSATRMVAIVVDKDGNVLANTDTEHAIVVFTADGKIAARWGKEFQGGLHGMCLRVETGEEVLYLAHTRRHEIVKTTIDGKVLWTLRLAAGLRRLREGGPVQSRPRWRSDRTGQHLRRRRLRAFLDPHLYDKERNYVKSLRRPGQGPPASCRRRTALARRPRQGAAAAGLRPREPPPAVVHDGR
jgi:hypothetical protein